MPYAKGAVTDKEIMSVPDKEIMAFVGWNR